MFSNQTLKRLIIPLIIEQVLVMAVGMADTMMVSYAGEAAISGVALVDMINNLIITILSALSTGGAVIVSQYLGNKDHQNANTSASQLMTITFLISTVFMVFALVCHQLLLNLFFGSVDINVMQAAVTYFMISSLSFPFLGIYNSSAALYRSMGKTKVTMYVSLGMNAINIIGNAIGVFVLHAGVAGVAVPTLLSRIFAGVVMMALAFNKENQVSICWRDILTWKRHMVKTILNIAIPNGIENGLFQLGKVLVTSIVALFGTTQIAANGVSNSINMIAIIVVNGINLAIVTVVGQCVGANEYEQAEKYTKKLMKIAYIATGILNVVVLILLPFILNFYTLSKETTELVYILVIAHNLMAFVLHPTSFVLANAIRASGDVKYTMYVGIGSMLIFRLGTAYIFGIVFQLGIIGVWMAMGMDWLIRSIAFMIRFKSGKWKEFRAI